MDQRSDWLPANRDGQLAMAKVGLPVMTANAEAWGIPPAVITDFTALTGAADTADTTAAKNETDPHTRGYGAVPGGV
ncbi:MAG: hypothetical protein LBP20_11170 [Treponema sp.]|nr:hypothetical protein [Treponema sp.]